MNETPVFDGQTLVFDAVYYRVLKILHIDCSASKQIKVISTNKIYNIVCVHTCTK